MWLCVLNICEIFGLVLLCFVGVDSGVVNFVLILNNYEILIRLKIIVILVYFFVLVVF